MILGSGIWVTSHYNGGGIALCLLIFSGMAFIVFVFGLAGYRANFIQFGLDQLLEAPSTSLALFIHWVIWAENLGTLMVQSFSTSILCNSYGLQHFYFPLCGLLIALMLIFLFIILCFRRRWFYVEPKQLNPYKMVVKVLNYARKHKYPVQRSAFTYCDNELSSRIDFAKERYGGPFTTEQVENVKTFFRILLVLLALGPVFVLEVPTSFFMFMVFGIHIGNHPSIVNQTCDSSLIILPKGSLNNIIGVLLYPLYIWFIFSVLRRCTPKIFTRLGVAISLSLLGVLSMLSIDFAGHYKYSLGHPSDNSTMCMFFIDPVSKDEAVLRLHWGLLLIPGVLLGLGPPLVMATTFEFISAQSPFAMKGLLVGVFLTIRAFFQLVSGTTLLPFAHGPLWNRPYLREHPPITSCGFGYFLTTFSIAFIGLILFLIVARRYKYRERDDRPYDQRFAVDVYGRYIEQAYSSYSSDDPYPDIPE
jgi:peptide/histidine transporter 3/4